MAQILALGAFCVEYIHDNWRDPLRRLFGDSVICVNFLPLARAMGERKSGRYLLRILDAHQCSAILLYSNWDWSPKFLASSVMAEIRRRGIEILVFYPDDEPGTWMDRNLAKFDRFFDRIATHSLQAYRIRKRNGHSGVQYMPWGFNPTRWHPVAVDSFTADIVFIGKNKVSTTARTEVEDGDIRDRLLLHVRDLAVKHGWRLRIYGFGWEQHPHLSAYSGGALAIEDIPRIVAEARIILNPAWAFHKDSAGLALPQLKLRHFEFYGCGALQVTNTNPELHALLGDTASVRYFDALDDIEAVLTDAIAARRHPGPMADPDMLLRHTVDNRIASMLDEAGIAVTERRHGTVGLICFRAAQDVPQIAHEIERLCANQPSLTHICFVDAQRFDCRFDTALLPPGRLDPERLYRFFFKVDYSRFQSNHLHAGDADGTLLVSCIDRNTDFAAARLKDGRFARDIFSPVAIGDRCLPLEALLIPVDRAVDVFRAYRDGRPIALPLPEEFPFYISELLPKSAATPIYRPWHLNSADKLLLRLFRMSRARGLTVSLYGIGGFLGQRAVALADETGFAFKHLVDNAKAGKTFRGRQVIGHRDLEADPPDIVVVSAEFSGPAIMRGIEASAIAVIVLPLHRVASLLWKNFFAGRDQRHVTPAPTADDRYRC